MIIQIIHAAFVRYVITYNFLNFPSYFQRTLYDLVQVEWPRMPGNRIRLKNEYENRISLDNRRIDNAYVFFFFSFQIAFIIFDRKPKISCSSFVRQLQPADRFGGIDIVLYENQNEPKHFSDGKIVIIFLFSKPLLDFSSLDFYSSGVRVQTILYDIISGVYVPKMLQNVRYTTGRGACVAIIHYNNILYYAVMLCTCAHNSSKPVPSIVRFFFFPLGYFDFNNVIT